MNKPHNLQLKRSQLFGRQFSLKEIINPQTSNPSERSAVFKRKDQCQPECDPHRELFSGLSYKKIDSLDTADCQQESPIKNEMLGGKQKKAFQEQKIRQQMNTLKKSMSATALARAFSEQNQQSQEPQLKTLKKMKKEQQIRKFTKLRKLSQQIQVNL